MIKMAIKKLFFYAITSVYSDAEVRMLMKIEEYFYITMTHAC